MSGGRLPAVGVDLCEIDRLARALERYPRLERRLFTEGESAYAAARRRPARHLAARFAAKEAAVKALGVWLGAREVEVVAGAPPTLLLHGRAARLAAERGIQLGVSLSHTATVAAAVVTAR